MMNKYLFLAILIVACVGCGGSEPASYHLQGNVTYDGKPVEEGAIILRDADRQGPSFRGEIVNGQFSIDAAPGKKIVQFRALRKTGRTVEANPGEVIDETAEYIPRKHNFESTLEIEVTGDQQGLNFDLAK